MHEHYEAKQTEGAEKEVEEKEKEEQPQKDNVDQGQLQVSAMMMSSRRVTYLWIVPVVILRPNGDSIATFALLDNASQRALMRDDVAEQLGLQGEDQPVDLTSVCNKKKVVFKEVYFGISSKEGKNHFRVEAAYVYVVPKREFNMPAQPPPPNTFDRDMFAHLDGIQLNEVKSEQISILVGADVTESILPTEVRCGARCQPFTINSLWMDAVWCCQEYLY